MNKELEKALRKYERARYELIKIRDQVFPEGTKVRCKLSSNVRGEVQGGSYYADQVRINNMHASFRSLEIVEETDEQ